MTTLDYLGGPAVVLTQGMQEETVRTEGAVVTGADIGMVCLEDSGRGYKPGNTGGHQKLGNTKKWIFPSELSEKTSPIDTLILTQ